MIIFVLPLNKYVKGNPSMSDNKEMLTIAVIAAALMMVLGTSIPSSVLATTSDSDSNDGGIQAAEPDKSSDKSDDKSSNDDGSKDDDEKDNDNDSSDSSSDGFPKKYLGEYETCVSDLSSDDNVLTQDDVVDCYGQVFGPNPTHDLGALDPQFTQSAPTSPGTNMPGFENMPFAMQQPGDQQPMWPFSQTEPQAGDQQQMQPFSQTEPQGGQQQSYPTQQQESYPAVDNQMQPLSQPQPQDEQQQMQPLGQTQPQSGQQLPTQQQQQQPSGIGDQHQMQLPLNAGILDVEDIRDLVKTRLGIN